MRSRSRTRLFFRTLLLAVLALAALYVAVIALAAIGRFLFVWALLLAAWHFRNRNLDGPDGQNRQTLLLLVLFGAVVAVLAAVREYADNAGFTVHYSYVIVGDKALFGGAVPSVWLQNQFFAQRIGLLEILCLVVYHSYFFMPILAGFLLARRDLEAFRVYTSAYLVAMTAGALYLVLVPTAPPWLASLHGYIPPVTHVAVFAIDQIVSGAYEKGNQIVGVNSVAAFPSYHIVQTTFVVFAVGRLNRRLTSPAVAYLVAMGFSLVYLGEHYVVDVLAGVLVALLAWCISLRFCRVDWFDMLVSIPSARRLIRAKD